MHSSALGVDHQSALYAALTPDRAYYRRRAGSRPSFRSSSCSSLPLTVSSALLSLHHVSVRSTLSRSPPGLARHASLSKICTDASHGEAPGAASCRTAFQQFVGLVVARSTRRAWPKQEGAQGGDQVRVRGDLDTAAVEQDHGAAADVAQGRRHESPRREVGVPDLRGQRRRGSRARRRAGRSVGRGTEGRQEGRDENAKAEACNPCTTGSKSGHVASGI
jgi:hypothetical protein